MKVMAFKLLGLAFPILLLTVLYFTVCVLITVFLILTVVVEVKPEFRKKSLFFSNFSVLQSFCGFLEQY
jgi:hypothetical protein